MKKIKRLLCLSILVLVVAIIIIAVKGDLEMKHLFRIGIIFIIIGALIVSYFAIFPPREPYKEPLIGNGNIIEKEFDYEVGREITIDIRVEKGTFVKLLFDKNATNIKVKSDSNILDFVYYATLNNTGHYIITIDSAIVINNSFLIKPSESFVITLPDIKEKVDIKCPVKLIDAPLAVEKSKSLTVSGNGKLEGKITALNIGDLDITVNEKNTCNLETTGNINNITLNISGELNFTSSGTANLLEIFSNNGSIDLDTFNLIAQNVKFTIKSNSLIDAKINAVKTLECNAQEVTNSDYIGEILYKGTPEIKKLGTENKIDITKASE